MTQALIRRFVKQYENTQDPHVRSAYETLAGFLGILCNLVLFAAKLAAGLLTGSIQAYIFALLAVVYSSSVQGEIVPENNLSNLEKGEK